MKKLLIASTALSLAGGAAFAEMAITVSGDAELGVDYASEPVADATTGAVGSKHSFVHEVGIDFTASGTTDGGLTFGGEAGFDTGDDVVNTGTVHVSGSFGTLTIGDNDAADLTAGGIADIGMNGIGVDDMVEGLRGTTAAQLRYDNDFGQIKIAISAGTKDGSAAKAAVPATVWYINDHNMTDHVYYPDLTATGGVSTPDHVIIHTFDNGGTPTDPSDDTLEPSRYVIERAKKDDGTYHYLGEISANSTAGTGTANTPAIYVAANKVDHEFDSLFDVLYRRIDNVATTDVNEGEVWVDPDGTPKSGTDKPPVNIYGFKRSDDGTKILDAAGTAVEADSPAAEAFKKYEANYDLGADEAVGGTNPPASATTGTKNADRVKVASNAMAAVPAVASDSEYAFGMSFNAGGVTIGVGYDSNKTVSMGAGFTTGEITTNLLYVKTDDDEDTAADEEMTGMGVDMAYAMGASTVTLSYGRRKPETGEAMDAVGMGVTHDLGGGATMNAGFGKVDKNIGTAASPMIVSENKASVGLMFAF